MEQGAGSLTTRLLNNLVSGARRTDTSSTAISAYASTLGGTLDVTIVNNTVGVNDTAIFVGNASGTVTGRVVNNAITKNDRGLVVDASAGALVADRNNLFFGNGIDFDLGDGVVPGPNTLFANPQYLSPFFLSTKPGSPLIDAGDASFTPLDLLTDIDGAPRIAGGAVDIGAFEVPEAGMPLAGASALAALCWLRYWNRAEFGAI